MARVLGAVLSGVDGVPVEVEVRIHAQLPRVDVVGLPEAAVRESAARVRALTATTCNGVFASVVERRKRPNPWPRVPSSCPTANE